MMKKIKTMFLAIASILMIAASCAKIDSAYDSRAIPTNDRGEYAILFNNSSILTKAAVTTTAKNGYDEFSLYAWNSSNDTIMNPFRVTGVAANSYKYEDVDGQKLQYFKNSADSYSFIGVIPTTNVKIKNGAVKVGVESFVVDDNRVSGTLAADSPKEFLWARADVTKGNYSDPVNLPFKHGNALLYLGFISDDGNTQIVDYTPSTGGTPDQPIYKLKGNPVAYIGPSVTDAENAGLTDADINYINSLFDYYAPHGYNWNPTTQTWVEINPTDEHWVGTTLISYWSTNNGGNAPQANSQDIYTQFSGDLSFNVWEYIVNKYPAFATMDISQWENTGKLQSNPNAVMKIVHLYKESGSLHAFMINPTNVTTTQIGVIPGTPGTPAIEGIRVFSAKADATDGYVHLAHTKTADATVAAGLTFDNRVAVTDSILFSLPGTVVPVGTTEAQAVYSPTTFYAIPGDAGLTHFVVKVSYTYKGTTVYDVRVPITLPAAGLEAGKYYKYIINITSTANGTNSVDEANNEKDDIDIVDNPIQVTTTITDYEKGDTQIVTI